jgi:hypothetical protein
MLRVASLIKWKGQTWRSGERRDYKINHHKTCPPYDVRFIVERKSTPFIILSRKIKKMLLLPLLFLLLLLFLFFFFFAFSRVQTGSAFFDSLSISPN